MRKTDRRLWPVGKVAYALPPVTEQEREEIWAQVVGNPDEPAGCWGWTGLVTTHGYAVWHKEAHPWRVHRLLYREIFKIDLPDRVFHHGCSNGKFGCVSPHCLSPISRVRNMHMVTTDADVDWVSREFLIRVRQQVESAYR
jgi:hypothetical protein